jgi:apolipoprotein D and lipocalin family protein
MTRVTLSTILLSLFAAMAFADLQTVPQVDVSRYVGTWYSIAKNPLFFQKGCVCSQQKLSLLPDGTVGVYNSCNIGSITGPLNSIEGIATSTDPLTNAKFVVDFNLPNKGDYWIIGLDIDYRYAVVSDPSMKSLYILSKTPTLSEDLYNQAVAEAAKQVDTSKLEMTLQQGCTYP